MKLDYGPSAYNTPQIFEVNYIYDLPWFKQQQGIEGKILGGWQISGITSIVSGSSFEVTQVTDPFACSSGDTCAVGTGLRGIGIQQGIFGEIAPRPDLVGQIHMPKKVGQWFTTSAFTTASGHYGSEGSNPILGPGMQRWDLAAIKNLNIGERVKFQLRGEFFNAFNHTSFSSVDSTIGDGAYGTVTGAHLKRVIQLGGKFNF
jgi:hypothetical protein